ncbi:MAG TPA: hypothetical protein VGB50_02470 [Flavobacterium sp.]|jgi:hypothetical protein
MNYKDLIYSATCLSFTTVIGGAVYEHLAVVPEWSAAPPLSLSMFQGEYGLNAGSFWKTIHPVTLAFFAATLIVSWKSARRINVLSAWLGYLAVLAVTAVYFVPELLDITSTVYSETINNDLTRRAKLWEVLSLVRLAAMVVMSIILFLGLTKNRERISHT